MDPRDETRQDGVTPPDDVSVDDAFADDVSVAEERTATDDLGSDEADSADDEAAEPTKKWGRGLRFVVWAAVAFVALALLVLPEFSTLQPGYYERYSGVRESMDRWRESTHARFGCGKCHIDPGFVGFVRFGLESIPAFYSQLFQGPSKTNLLGIPPSEACYRCHTTNRSVSANGDLLIPHRAHIELLKIECAHCHRQLVHFESELGLNRPPMKMCMECHNGEKATSECSKCHTRKQVPQDHRQPNWLEVHREQSEKVDCGTCHGWTPDFCDQCHKDRPRSHEGNFKKRHAVRAQKSTSGCLFCHEDKFCQRCH